MPVIVGFTGTQGGMTPLQKLEFASRLPQILGVEFHHGDCIGSDEEADKIVRRTCLNHRVIVHPPVKDAKRAWVALFDEDVLLDPKDYIPRNHDIVDAVEEMFATPKGLEEERRSGTWATIRYAWKVEKPITIIFPDGTTKGSHD